MGFPMSHQPKLCVTFNFPKMDSDTQICHFSDKFRQITLKVSYKVLLYKNFQQQICSAVNYLSNGINISAGGDPIPVKFGPKSSDPH